MVSIEKHVKKSLKQFREYERITDIWEMGRRVFAKNSFDGVLTIMGVILGSYYAGVTNPRIVVITGVGASIAIGVSGIWATYYTEKAERRKKMLELERATLRKLSNTRIEKAERFATIIISLIDGLSPFFASLIVLTPFILVNGYNMSYGYMSSIAIAFLILGMLGAFLGRISKENVVKGAIRMVVAGVVCILLTLFLQRV